MKHNLPGAPVFEPDNEVSRLVLEWWAEHECDTFPDGDCGEFNAYDSEPAFVTAAKAVVANSHRHDVSLKDIHNPPGAPHDRA